MADILRLQVGVDADQGIRALETVGIKAQRVEAGATSLGGALGSLRGAFGGLAALGIGAAVSRLDDLFRRMQDIREVSAGFSYFSRQAGLSLDTLGKLADATDHEITRMELMRQTSLALSLGVARSTDEMVRLVAAAEGAADTMGIDATRAVDLVVSSIARLTDRQLAQLGVMLDQERVWAQYAATLGKTAEQLTEVEKRTAFTSAAVAELERVAESAQQQTITWSGMWVKGTTAMQDAWAALLDFVNTNPLPFDPFERRGAAMFPAAAAPAPTRGVADLDALLGPLGPVQYGPGTNANVPVPPGFYDPIRITTGAGIPQTSERSMQALGIDISIGERQSAEQEAQDALLAVRIAAAEMWSSQQEALDTERLENEYERNIAALEALGAESVAMKEAQEIALTHLHDQYAAQREERTQREVDAEREQRWQLAEAAAGLVGALFKQDKAAAIASAIINTAQGITFALSHKDFVSAAIIAAAGAKQIITIRRTHIGSSGGGGGAVSAAGSGAATGGAGATVGAPAPAQLQVTIDVRGLAFVQDADEFARLMAETIGQQLGRAGLVNLVGTT